MKKVATVVGFVVVLVALVYGIVGMLASNASSAIAKKWRTIESDEAFAAKFPPVKAKNDVATALEGAAMTLGIGMMPKPELDALAEGSIDKAQFVRFKQAADGWIQASVEAPDDSITAPPEEVSRYLEENRAPIDMLLATLERGDAPRWPVSFEGNSQSRPLPNLLGQMQLSRLLSAVSLSAKRAGDDARAWRAQGAAWTLAKGMLSRPEMISQLIGVALVRGIAGVSRKLEGPTPAWFGEVERFDFHRSMLDSCRAEWNASSEAVFGAGFVEQMRDAARAESPHVGRIVREVATRPFVQWGLTEMENVTVDELLKLQRAEPCDIDSRAIAASIESRVPRIARVIAGDFLPSTHLAFSRVAMAKIAIEGTSKIVELKARRTATADRAWPDQADDLATSSCSRTRWRYERNGDGSIRLVFEGKVDVPRGTQGYSIPTEYLAK
ncbi:MAG: hypothetical protein HYU52_14555 [Acidobacteria bacterium]|nr:hypothetical protein [Acidobacteriota bacterium]